MKEIGSIVSARHEVLLKMWQVEVAPGWLGLRQHSHIRFEIGRVMGGSGRYVCNGKRYPMQPGDVFVFCANEVHCIEEVGDEGLLLTNLQFEPRYLWGHPSDSLSEKNSGLCFSHATSFENRIEAARAGELTGWLKEIEEELTQCRPEYPLAVKCAVDKILLSLVRTYAFPDSSSAVSRLHIRGIRKVITYIDEHLTDKITLEAAADLAGVSPHYFSLLFHKASNMRFQDYVNARRIEKAIGYLREADDERSMLDIALSCGFNNSANFNKAFKKQTGMTPRDYRRHGDDMS